MFNTMGNSGDGDRGKIRTTYFGSMAVPPMMSEVASQATALTIRYVISAGKDAGGVERMFLCRVEPPAAGASTDIPTVVSSQRRLDTVDVDCFGDLGNELQFVVDKQLTRGSYDTVEPADDVSDPELVVQSSAECDVLVARAPCALRVAWVEGVVKPPGRYIEDVDHRVFSETDGTVMTNVTLSGGEVLRLDISGSDKRFYHFVRCSPIAGKRADQQEQEGFVKRDTMIVQEYVHLQYSLDNGLRWSAPFRAPHGNSRDPSGNGLLESLTLDLTRPHKAKDSWNVCKTGDLFDINRTSPQGGVVLGDAPRIH